MMTAERDNRRSLVKPVTVYVASKSEHGPAWQDLRAVWREGAGFDRPVEVISTWIDESGAGMSSDLGDLWRRCIAEASSADLLIAWYQPGETWKGAYIEIGAALANGKPVYVCGNPPGSWKAHPLVTLASSPDDAIADYLAGLPEVEVP